MRQFCSNSVANERTLRSEAVSIVTEGGNVKITIQRGFRYVRVHCAQCHAIDKVSASPVTNAPPFRVLNLKYGVADLQRPLAEGVHPMMPLFRLSPGEIEDVMAYLKTLR